MIPQLGKALIMMGAVLVVVGVVFLFFDKLPFLGKLPGDITYRKGNFTFYMPLATMLLLSVVLTILLNLFRK